MSLLRSYDEGKLTTLNTLRYGDSETIGKEPIVQKPIPLTIEQNGPSHTQGTRQIDDLKRISTLLTRAEGLNYLANETLLNKVEINPVNKKTGEPKSAVGRFISQVGANLWNTTKIIGSTLAQVPLNGTGTHFVKGFAGKGRRTYLSGLDIAPHVLVRNGGTLPDVLDTIIEGSAIPTGSILGTPPDIRHRTNVIFGYSKNIKKEERYKLSQITARSDDRGTTEKFIEDKETTIFGDEIQVKTVNYLSDTVFPIVDAKTSQRPSDSVSTNEVEVLPVDPDFIKFNFRVVTPDNFIGTPLYFRAYLDSFNDLYTGTWNPVKYIGRGENFYTYSGHERQVAFSFKIAAQTRLEIQPLYEKLNWLASSTAPSYNAGGTFMRGTLVKVNIGDYLKDNIGFITNLNLSWNNNYPWETATPYFPPGSDLLVEDGVPQLPHVLECDVSYTIIQNFTPQAGTIGFIGDTASLIETKPTLFTAE